MPRFSRVSLSRRMFCWIFRYPIQGSSADLVSLWCRLRVVVCGRRDRAWQAVGDEVLGGSTGGCSPAAKPAGGTGPGCVAVADPAVVGSCKILLANSAPFGVRTKQVVVTKLKPTLLRNERCGSP